MMILNAKEVASALPYDELIEALKAAFASDVEVPQRAHHEVPVPGANDGTLLLMPAWQAGRSMGVKIATVFPDNAQHDYPAVFASYFLMSAASGLPVAVLDGTELTVRRTAAASALASSYLSRQDARKLLMVGTGNLAPHLIAAHATARPIEEVVIWGRRQTAAEKLAKKVSAPVLSVSVTDDLESAVQDADIISCATLATDPLIKGAWLREGQHLDLVGAFKPEMREADTEAVCRSRLFVDTRAGAVAEAGEIVQAIESGSISEADIVGELSELTSASIAGRNTAAEITLFKSVGTALEDLAAAELALRNHTRDS